MTTEILTRTLFALAIAGIGVSVYGLYNRIVLRRASKSGYQGLDGFQPGMPAILYFTTPTCVPCKTLQRPAINTARQAVGGKLQVIEIDAVAQSELANYWGVLSVPTTFIISKKGEPRHVNHGVALADKLLKQIKKFT